MSHPKDLFCGGSFFQTIIMKILVIQTAFIGDVILATPIIEKLHRFYPNASIDFLLRAGNQSLLTAHPLLRKIMIWNKKKGKYKALMGLLRQIRSENYDMVINCQRFAASGFLTAFSGAKQSIGFEKNPFSFLFSTKVKHQIGRGLHETARNLLLIQHFTDGSVEKPRLYPTPDDWAKVAEYRTNSPYICIAPTSVWHTKQWPMHRWVELIRALPDQVFVFLLGGPDDFYDCEIILEQCSKKNLINLSGKIGLLASAALMKNAVMNYVNDSAPMHLASAVDAPVTAVFCSTLPSFGFTPLSTVSHVIETPEQLSCRPCGLHGKKSCPLGHFRCAEGIQLNQFPSLSL